MNIVVLAGGLSTERDVSLSTGSMVCRALRQNGHHAILLDAYLGTELPLGSAPSGLFKEAQGDQEIIHTPETAPDLDKVRAERADGGASFFGPNVVALCEAADLVFIALHGVCGEDGKLQAAFDLLGIRYTGSGSLGSALAMDKAVTKTLLTAAGIKTAEWRSVCRGSSPAEIAGVLGLPCVVKPRNGGSSIGVAIPSSIEELSRSLDGAFCYDDLLIAEKYIPGREFSVGILDGRALPVIEIVPHRGFYDFKNKYQAGLTDELCPARLDGEMAARVQMLALRAHRALRLGSYSRIDFILDRETGEFVCLEANTLPGMTPTSLLPQEAAAEGVSYGALCEKLVAAALRD